MGLVKGKQPDINSILSKYVEDGDQLVRMTFIMKHSWTDVLISGITFGVYTPVTVIIKGTVNKKIEKAKSGITSNKRRR